METACKTQNNLQYSIIIALKRTQRKLLDMNYNFTAYETENFTTPVFLFQTIHEAIQADLLAYREVAPRLNPAWRH